MNELRLDGIGALPLDELFARIELLDSRRLSGACVTAITLLAAKSTALRIGRERELLADVRAAACARYRPFA